jgi:membrane protein implicated in regulation of membrane protease activity
MKILIVILAVILLATPVALLIIFNTPGLGILLAIFLVAVVYFRHQTRSTAKTKGMQQKNDAGYKKAA